MNVVKNHILNEGRLRVSVAALCSIVPDKHMNLSMLAHFRGIQQGISGSS